MEKLSDTASIVVDIGGACRTHNVREEDLPDGLCSILESLRTYVLRHDTRRDLTERSELHDVERALKECVEIKGVRKLLLRKEILGRIKRHDVKLSAILRKFQVSSGFDFWLLSFD